MTQYLIEREIAGAGGMSKQALCDASRHSNAVPITHPGGGHGLDVRVGKGYTNQGSKSVIVRVW